MYIGAGFVDQRWRQNRPELERQGELFAYMHQQMLARYDVERRSWGLNYVQVIVAMNMLLEIRS